MKRLLTLVAFFATLEASAQQVNPVPDYVFRNQMSVGRNAVTDTGAYFSIGPRYGAVKGFMPPIVSDTASVNANKRNGLLIFSVQKNKFLYWDSVRVQWSDMAGSSGSYITGSGITGYVPQFNGTTTIDTSALFTIGNRLGVGTSSFAYNTTSTANVELNGTAGGILGFKRNDSARGYLWHTGDNMELANTMAGSIYFNTNSATRGSIASDGVWRLHGLAGTGDRVVVASSNGTLSAASSATGLVDTLTISTRAWRQKGDDSLGAIIATKGSGTVTSVATGYGLSGGTITTTGTLLVDTLNIATRAWRQKGLDSLAALEVSGSGTTNYVPKFTASSTIGNSQIFDDGASVGIGTSSSSYKLDINGTLRSVNGANFATTSGEVLIGTTSDAGDYKLQVSGNIYNTGSAVLAATSGNVGIGASPSAWTWKALQNGAFSMANVSNVGFLTANAFWDGAYKYINTGAAQALEINNGNEFRFLTAASGTSGTAITFTQAMTLNAASELLVNTTSDAGDYKLQVVGNARIGTGKLDIASNTTFGLGVARSGTSEIAGQIYNSNGILYLGAESSAGGAIFTGSSAYAAVIGSGANYPLQFATNNATRATINTNGELLINTTSDAGDFKLQVNGNGLISGSIKTANGGSSTAAAWHLGSVVATSVQLDTANYVEVEINGTFYRLAIVTPL